METSLNFQNAQAALTFASFSKSDAWQPALRMVLPAFTFAEQASSIQALVNPLLSKGVITTNVIAINLNPCMGLAQRKNFTKSAASVGQVE
jgi:hypothetical protein